jgi:outer membrane receptor protein involved in Fe transport
LAGDFEAAAEDTVAESWEWKLTGSWGRSRYRLLVPDTLRGPLQDALNSCGPGSDLTGCFNPFASANDGTGTPNSAAVIQQIRGAQFVVADSMLATAEGELTGKLFELPGGDFGFAIGAQYRREDRASQLDRDANLEQYVFIIGNSDGAAGRGIGSGYAELLWPFYDGIELNTAGRIENYQGFGTVANPAVGLTITPSEIAGRDNVVGSLQRLLFRGQASTSFRAPSIYEILPGATNSIRALDDGGPANPIVPVRLHGNPNLDPETSTFFGGGIDWSPIKELGFTADYWNYHYDNVIVGDDPQGIVDKDKDVPDPDHVQRDEMGRLLSVDTTAYNAAFANTHGIDFGAIVSLELDDIGLTSTEAGTISLGTDGSYVLSFDVPRDRVPEIKLANGTKVPPPRCDAKKCDVAGRGGNAAPRTKLRLNVPLTWLYDGHALNFTLHYIGTLEDPLESDPKTGELDITPAWVTLDFTYGYTLKDTIGTATTFRLGVLNLLDEDPPLVDGSSSGGFNPLTHDPRGRMLYAKLTQEF